MSNYKVNGNDDPSTAAVIIPTIVVTDYDAELASQQTTNQEIRSASQQTTNQEISSEITRSEQINNRLESSRKTSVNESEEEDREIINSLTEAHLGNSEIDVDADEAARSITTKKENSSMAKVLSDDSERHIEGAIAPRTAVKNDPTEENVKLLPSTELPKVESKEKFKQQSDSATADDLAADLEVSHLTDLIESNQAFVPLPGAILTSQRSTKKIVPMMGPPGKLPNISDVNIPQYGVPVKKVTLPHDPLFPESRRYPDFNVLPLSGEASSTVEDSQFNRSGCMPINGGRKNRTARLFGENDTPRSNSSYSESSDDQPPFLWRLSDSSNSTDKSDGDDNVLTNSTTNLTKSSSSPKKSEDDDKEKN